MKTPGSAEGAARARTRPVFRRLSLSLVALAFAVFAASALAGSFAAKGSFVISSSITSADPVVSSPAYTTTRGDCSTPLPILQLAGNYHYEVVRFRQLSSVGSCVNVSLLVNSGTADASGYRGPFNPLNPTFGFAGSAGSGGGLGPDQAADFAYPAGPGTFDVVVWERTQNGGATYTLLVEGLGVIMVGGGPTATASLQSFRASSAPKGVRVRWKTRSEHEALGFNVYRGDRKKVRLTRSMVRASGDGRGHTYSYIDRAARKGKAGPYWLQVVQRNGSKIMFGPALTTAR
jgi:hypothetical protein